MVGAKTKWKQLANVNYAVFAMRRSFKRKDAPKPTDTQRSVPSKPASEGNSYGALLTDDELKALVSNGTIKDVDKKYSTRKALCSNGLFSHSQKDTSDLPLHWTENCDVYTAKTKGADKAPVAIKAHAAVIQVLEN